MANTFFKITLVFTLAAALTACAPMESHREPVFYTGGSGGGGDVVETVGRESLADSQTRSNKTNPGETTSEPTGTSTPDAPSTFGG